MPKLYGGQVNVHAIVIDKTIAVKSGLFPTAYVIAYDKSVARSAQYCLFFGEKSKADAIAMPIATQICE